LRDLIASFGQNMITVPSETTHVWVKFDRDHACCDPVDACLSRWGLLFAAEQRHTCDVVGLGRCCSSNRKRMRHWEEVLPEAVMLNAYYENVIDDVQGQTRRLIAHGVVPRVLQGTRS
jgi:hypothetical protein